MSTTLPSRSREPARSRPVCTKPFVSMTRPRRGVGLGRADGEPLQAEAAVVLGDERVPDDQPARLGGHAPAAGRGVRPVADLAAPARASRRRPRCWRAARRWPGRRPPSRCRCPRRAARCGRRRTSAPPRACTGRGGRRTSGGSARRGRPPGSAGGRRAGARGAPTFAPTMRGTSYHGWRGTLGRRRAACRPRRRAARRAAAATGADRAVEREAQPPGEPCARPSCRGSPTRSRSQAALLEAPGEQQPQRALHDAAAPRPRGATRRRPRRGAPARCAARWCRRTAVRPSSSTASTANPHSCPRASRRASTWRDEALRVVEGVVGIGTVVHCLAERVVALLETSPSASAGAVGAEGDRAVGRASGPSGNLMAAPCR